MKDKELESKTLVFFNEEDELTYYRELLDGILDRLEKDSLRILTDEEAYFITNRKLLIKTISSYSAEGMDVAIAKASLIKTLIEGINNGEITWLNPPEYFLKFFAGSVVAGVIVIPTFACCIFAKIAWAGCKMLGKCLTRN